MSLKIRKQNSPRKPSTSSNEATVKPTSKDLDPGPMTRKQWEKIQKWVPQEPPGEILSSL